MHGIGNNLCALHIGFFFFFFTMCREVAIIVFILKNERKVAKVVNANLSSAGERDFLIAQYIIEARIVEAQNLRRLE